MFLGIGINRLHSEHRVRFHPPTEYVLPFRHPLEVTVQLKKHKLGGPDAVMRPCLDCYQHLMEIGIQRNVRLPSSDKEPSLLEQLAEFHITPPGA